MSPVFATRSLIAAAALLTYWQGFRLPLISDDYLVIDLARQYAEEPGGWTVLAGDALYRTRAVYMWLTAQLYAVAGLTSAAYAALSLALHALNAVVAFDVGQRWLPLPVAALMGLIFAVHHGHQEAVWWYSALPDQLVLLFALAAIACWRRWCQGEGITWWNLALVAFTLALGSKESAVTIPGLLAGAAVWMGLPARRWITALTPFGLLSAAYFLASYAARENHLHFNDGTFALGWHFPGVILRSTFRMLWPWGIAALAVLVATRRQHPRALGVTLMVSGWIALTLLPYSFLTYMPFVPSRHTYPASLAAALVLAMGIVAAQQRWRWKLRVVAAVVIAFTVTEWGYLWTRKFRQYQQRGEPTEILRTITAGRPGELHLACSVYPANMLESMFRLTAGGKVRIVRDPGFRETFDCPTREAARFVPD